MKAFSIALVLSAVIAASGPSLAGPLKVPPHDPSSFAPVQNTPNNYPPVILVMDAAQGGVRMRAIWDLRTTASSRIAKASLTNWSAYSYPSGISKTAGNPPNSEEINVVNAVSGSNTLSGIDFSDASLTIQNNGTAVTVNDFYLRDSGGVHALNLGATEGGLVRGTPGAIAFNYGTFDYTGVSNNGASPIDLFAVTSLSFNTVAFDNSPGDLVVISGAISFTSSYFGGFGQNPKSTNVFPTCTTANKAHVEPVKLNGGVWTFQDVLIDPSDLPVADSCKAGYTSVGPFFDASAGPLTPVTATLDRVVMVGADYVNSHGQSVLYTMQTKCTVVVSGGVDYDPQNTIVTISNSAIQRAPNGYNTNTTNGRLTLTGVSGTFSVNELITESGGATTAKVLAWTPATGELQIYPAGGVSAQWNGDGAMSGTITGATSHATATISTAALPVCKLVDGGGNYDFDSALPITLTN